MDQNGEYLPPRDASIVVQNPKATYRIINSSEALPKSDSGKPGENKFEWSLLGGTGDIPGARACAEDRGGHSQSAADLSRSPNLYQSRGWGVYTVVG